MIFYKSIYFIGVIDNMNVKKINLNLLIALDALLSECSVSQAAKKCFVTQAAMSNTLSQLRDVFDDPLFVRQSKGMLPTPRALALQPKVTELMQQVEELLSNNTFDPAEATQHFTLALADHGRYLILPKLIKKINKLAPKVTLTIINLRADVTPAEFEKLNIDLGIGVELNNSASFGHAVLFMEEPVCVSRTKKILSLADYKNSLHVAIKYNPEAKHSFVDQQLKNKKIKRNIMISSANLITGLEVIANTQYIGTFPKRLSEHFQSYYRYHIQPAPFATTQNEVQLIWHKRNDKCIANQWLRQLILDIAHKEIP